LLARHNALILFTSLCHSITLGCAGETGSSGGLNSATTSTRARRVFGVELRALLDGEDVPDLVLRIGMR
jgi:hypothetical protein